MRLSFFLIKLQACFPANIMNFLRMVFFYRKPLVAVAAKKAMTRFSNQLIFLLELA